MASQPQELTTLPARLETLLEMADVYGVAAADIVREVEEARRAERVQRTVHTD